MKQKAPTPTRRKPKPTTGPRTYGRFQRALDDAARREIEMALREADGVITETARLLGISRIALRARMNALGIRG